MTIIVKAYDGGNIHLKWAWIRWAFGIIVGVALATIISVYIQRDNLIEGCLRGGDRSLIEADFYEQAAGIRKKDGDHKVAKKYHRDSIRMRATIPMPSGWNGVAKTRGENKQERFEGCQDAFPAPIPWVE